VYVTVYYDPNSVTASGFEASIQGIVSVMAVLIGQSVTVAMVMQALVGFSFALITGGLVSLDGIAWKNEVSVPANKIAVFALANITVAPQP
jgi:hypothetical protein